MRAHERSGLAVGAAMILAMVAWLPLTQDRSFLVGGTALVVALTLAGLAVRSLRAPEWLVHLIQTGVGAVFLSGLSWLSGLGAVPGLDLVTRQAARHIWDSAAPMPFDAAVRLALVAGLAVLTILADELAVTLRVTSLSAVPVFTPFLIPALALPEQLPFWLFCLPMAGYLLILAADRTGPAAPAAGGNLAAASHWTLAAGLAATALVAVQAVGGVVPLRSAGAVRWNVGPIQVSDPSLDLRRNLTLPADRVVLTYRTDGPTGSYLRMASLPAFSAAGWQLAAMRVETGPLPAPPGLAVVPGERRTTEIQIVDLETDWLPLPYAPVWVSVPGPWGHDPRSLTLLATGSNKAATRNLNYRVTSVDATPAPEALAAAEAGDPGDEGLTQGLPADLPSRITRLAARVTASARTDGQRGLAIQAYLRSGEFLYSTEPAPGTGFAALTDFLFVDRTGYCEQFAASMAVLARAVGIPSRVAVGFTAGTREGDHYQVTAHQMHAWPELYFESLGWVSFEPTPGTGGSPTGMDPEGETPTPSATAQPTAAGSPTATSAGSERPDVDSPAVAADGSDGFCGWGWLIVAAVALAAVPLTRVVVRAWRLGDHRSPADQVESAWAEVRASVVDLGRAWPAGSPRVIGATVAAALPEPAAAAMRRLAASLERARFAASAPEAPTAADDARLVRRALLAGASGGRRWRSLMWPRSLWRSART